MNCWLGLKKHSWSKWIEYDRREMYWFPPYYIAWVSTCMKCDKIRAKVYQWRPRNGVIF